MATFQELNSHMQPVATILASVSQDHWKEMLFSR